MNRYAAPAFVSVSAIAAMWIAVSTGLAYAGPDEVGDTSGDVPYPQALDGDLDWGDAPDDPQNPGDYPTLADSGGRVTHCIKGICSLAHFWSASTHFSNATCVVCHGP